MVRVMLFRQSYIEALEKQLAKTPANDFARNATEALDAIKAMTQADMRGARKPIGAEAFFTHSEKLRLSLLGLATQQTLADITNVPSAGENVVAMPNRAATLYKQGRLDTITNDQTNPWNGLLKDLGKQVDEVSVAYGLRSHANQR